MQRANLMDKFKNGSDGFGKVGDLIKYRVAVWMKVIFDIKMYTVENFKGFLDGIRLLNYIVILRCALSNFLLNNFCPF